MFTSDRAAFLDSITEAGPGCFAMPAFADWLDEQGEVEEADGWRRLHAGKKWPIASIDLPGSFLWWQTKGGARDKADDVPTGLLLLGIKRVDKTGAENYQYPSLKSALTDAARALGLDSMKAVMSGEIASLLATSR